jgi:hypothetical protein
MFVVEKCVDKEIKKIFNLISKYRKITFFVNDLMAIDK